MLQSDKNTDYNEALAREKNVISTIHQAGYRRDARNRQNGDYLLTEGDGFQRYQYY